MAQHTFKALLLRVVSEHYERYGSDDRFTKRDWDDARRRASLLTRSDIQPSDWDELVDKFCELRAVEEGQPTYLLMFTPDDDGRYTTELEACRDDLNAAIIRMTPFTWWRAAA